MASAWNSVKKYIKSINREAEELLIDELNENPFFPYKMLHVQKFIIKQRYMEFYLSLVGFVISFAVIIVWTIIGVVNGFSIKSVLYPIPFLALFVCTAGLLNYSEYKNYAIYPGKSQYTFSFDEEEQIRGPYHNIYVRLRKTRQGSKSWYYLVLKGYQMEKVKICKPTKNVEELRKLGQLIASNLNLNYFDEANISKHHIIRHLRSNRDLFTFRKI